MDATHEAVTTSAAEVVLRYDVVEAHTTTFVDAVSRWVTALMDGDRAGPRVDTSEVTLLQPVVAARPTEWELRIAFPSFEALGRHLDRHGGVMPSLPDSPEQWRSVDVDSPVLRHVPLPGEEAQAPSERGRQE